jgi:hypothetical protein
MAEKQKPHGLTLRAYQVGFGDCFLLTFHYAKMERHVLVDFGSTGQPETAGKDLMVRVAKDIQSKCGGKLHAVVATHRHKDHISGFATRKDGKGSGDIIASCDPDVVIQPWTEDPDAQPDATRATRLSSGSKAFVASLQSMHKVSEAVLAQVEQLRPRLGLRLAEELAFLGDDNISNRSAVENLMTMGKRRFYVQFGSRSGLESILPGVKTHVLGPPTLEQSEEISKQRSKDQAEFWHLRALSGDRTARTVSRLFPKAASYDSEDLPAETRWFVSRMQNVYGNELLGIVRALDHAMNNTSLILLFEVGGKKLLFPGDAQIENWSYALGRANVRRLLGGVNLYKVGHHGSLNATPKTLWNLFENRSARRSPARLQTVCSTMPGKHGSVDRSTEVPRTTLVKELKAKSDYFTTESLKGSKTVVKEFSIEL